MKEKMDHLMATGRLLIIDHLILGVVFALVRLIVECDIFS